MLIYYVTFSLLELLLRSLKKLCQLSPSKFNNLCCIDSVLYQDRLQGGGDEVSAMVGDTNLFLQEDGVAEAEIMIAEVEARGGGLGREAMLLMLRYGAETLKVKQFQAKIKFSNTTSQNMFTKLGFKESSRSEVFCETTYICDVDKDFCDQLKQNTNWNIGKYMH